MRRRSKVMTIVAALVAAAAHSGSDHLRLDSGGPPKPRAESEGPGLRAEGPGLQQADVAPASGAAAVSGVVRDAITGQALEGVIVALRLPPQIDSPLASTVRVLTDARGRFVFGGLPAGSGYRLSAQHPDYVEASYGQSRMLAPENRFGLDAGQWLASADISMWKPGAIGGRVLDEHNEPMVEVHVRALARVTIAGRTQMVASHATMTDDRGVYRIAGLPPGDYVVQMPTVQASVPSGRHVALGQERNLSTTLRLGSMIPPPPRVDAALDPVGTHQQVVGNYGTSVPAADGRARVYPITFHPNARNPSEASVVALAPGESRAAVDIIAVPVPTSHVFGRVTGPSDALEGLVVRLMPEALDGLSIGAEAATSLVAGDGRFAFLNVPSGDYVVDATRAPLELTYLSDRSTVPVPQTVGTTLGGASSGPLDAGPPGTGYVHRSGRYDDLFWARERLTVGDVDQHDVVIALREGVTIDGRFVYEGTSQAIAVRRMGGVVGSASADLAALIRTELPERAPQIVAEPAHGDPWLGLPRTRFDPDGGPIDAFTLEGLKGGEYVLRVRSGADRFSMKSITVNGVDVTHRPIDTSSLDGLVQVEIAFTDLVTELTGFVRGTSDSARLPVVIAFPVERDQWRGYGFTPLRIRTAPASAEAGYEIRGLPAGDYYLIAVPPESGTAWQDPAFLERAAAGATRVTLGWGDQRAIDLDEVTIR